MDANSKIPPIQTFKNITVVPLLSEITGKVQDSGPIWPDWDSQVAVRHCRNGLPIDNCPRVPEKIDAYVDEPLIWAGKTNAHFGHYIAEDASRILLALQSSKTKPLLFGSRLTRLSRTGKLEDAPPVFLQIAKWFGLPVERIKICTQNMRVSTLEAAPQAEQLYNLRQRQDQFIPPSEYLDLLDQNTHKNALTPIRNKMVFVSRGKIPRYLDAHGGSQYLDAVLRELGVFVFHPEEHDLEVQLAVYAGAEQLIFAEGSAVHGLQLLGKSQNSLAILNRRPNSKIANFSLEGRYKEHQYIEAVDSVIFWKNPTFGNGKRPPAVISRRSIFNTNALLESFSALGINLASVWDEKTYRIALEDDLKTWIPATGELSLRKWGALGDQLELVQSLKERGFSSSATFAEDYLSGN